MSRKEHARSGVFSDQVSWGATHKLGKITDKVLPQYRFRLARRSGCFQGRLCRRDMSQFSSRQQSNISDLYHLKIFVLCAQLLGLSTFLEKLTRPSSQTCLLTWKKVSDVSSFFVVLPSFRDGDIGSGEMEVSRPINRWQIREGRKEGKESVTKTLAGSTCTLFSTFGIFHL